MIKLKISALCISVLLILSTHIHASETVSGLFEAQDACEATRKLNSSNPGNVTLKVGEIYDLLAINSAEPSHFLIDIPDAPEITKRWVGVECGDIALDDPDRVLKLKPISAEEKKIGNDDIVGETNGEEDFIAIKRHGYRLSDGPSPRSMDSHSMDSRSYQSSALKGAQDILRKNRRRRVEM